MPPKWGINPPILNSVSRWFLTLPLAAAIVPLLGAKVGSHSDKRFVRSGFGNSRCARTCPARGGGGRIVLRGRHRSRATISGGVVAPVIAWSPDRRGNRRIENPGERSSGRSNVVATKGCRFTLGSRTFNLQPSTFNLQPVFLPAVGCFAPRGRPASRRRDQ